MDIAVDLLKSENLKPVDQKTLEEWRIKYPDSYVPQIEAYIG